MSKPKKEKATINCQKAGRWPKTRVAGFEPELLIEMSVLTLNYTRPIFL